MMKKFLFTIVILAVIISFISLVTSCFQENDITCTNCKPRKHDYVKSSLLYFINKNKEEKILTWYSNKYNYGKSSIDGSSFKAFQSIINNIAGEKLDPVNIIIFLKGSILNYDIIKLDNIIGIIPYFLKDSKLYMRIYLKDEENNNYKEITEMRCRVDGIIVNEIYLVMDNMIPELSNHYKSCINISSEERLTQPKIKFDNSYSEFNLKAKRYINKNKSRESNSLKKLNSKLLDINPNERICPSPCVSIKGDYKCDDTHPTQPHYCTERGCGCKNFYGALIDSSAIPVDSLNLIYDFNLHYKYRDSILKKGSSFGDKYYYYFFDLSEYLENIYVPIPLKIQTSLVLLEYNDSIKMLLNPNTYGNSIFLNINLRNNIVALINTYKSLSTDSVYHNTLDDIISDVNNFTNYTVNEFLEEINQ